MHDWGYPDPLAIAADRKAQGEVRVYMARCDSPNPTYRQTTHFELLAMTDRPEGDGDTRNFWPITSVDSQGNVTEEVLPVPRDPAAEAWLEVQLGQTTEERMADLNERIDRQAALREQSVEQRLAALEAAVKRLEAR